MLTRKSAYDMNIRSSSETRSRLIPNHQRIISSKQWVIEDKNNKNQAMGKIDDRKTSHQSTDTIKRAPKELETAKLQMEYNSVKQENDKLKNVIGKLKQEIDIYTNLLNTTTPGVAPPNTKHKTKALKPQEAAVMKSLLINTSKRRKKSDVSAASTTKPTRTQTPQAPTPHTTSTTTSTTTSSLAGLPSSISTHPSAPKDVSAPSQVSDEMVSPDDIMLMNTLTDVLNHMK